MQCPNSPVYNTSVEQKRHAKNVAKQRRLGTTNLRELLRDVSMKTSLSLVYNFNIVFYENRNVANVL